MKFSFFNPFSSKFMQVEPEHSEQRNLEANLNSYGHSEDILDWRRLVQGYGNNYVEPSDPYEIHNILFETIFANKRQRINYYRQMSLFPIIHKFISIMADESVSENSVGEYTTFGIDESNKGKFKESELMTLKQEFDYIINEVIGKDQLWYYYYKWLVDGELFWEICLNEDKDRVAGIKCLPPYCTMCVYDDGVIQGYIEDTKMMFQDETGEVKKFTTNQIAYANYGFWGNNRNDIRGHLEPAIRPYNQLRSIQDSLVIYRMTRAPEKRVFNIYTGKLPTAKIPEFMQQTRAKYKKQLTIDPHTGMINSNQNTQAFTEDFWFSKDADGQGSSVENFKGSTEFNGQLDDLNMFREEVADALQIPTSRWKSAEQQGQYTQGIEGLSIDEASFQKLNKRLRKKFIDIIYQVFLVHLQVRGYKSKYLDKKLYKIDLIPATDFDKMKELSLAEKRGGVIGAFSQFLPTLANSKEDSEELQPLMSRQFFLEKVLGYTQAERIENDKLIELEKQQIIEAAKSVKEEGGETAEELESDDLGF